MKTENHLFFFKKSNFLIFKIFLWVCLGIFFVSFSLIIPTTPDSILKELISFILIAFVVNIHISFLYPKISQKSKWGYFGLLIVSLLVCAFFELLLFLNKLDNIYSSFVDRTKLYFVFGGYISIRDFSILFFFFGVESINRLISLFHEKEKIHQEEMALLIEKQDFEKKFSRKKLLPHYFFNILEHFSFNSQAQNNNLFEKVKFVLYYFLVDAEKEKIELEKEIAFYDYYIELENFKRKNKIKVNLTILGQTEKYSIIPLLFEPLIGNAMKYTKSDGTGWVDIEIDVTSFPIINFICKNNFSSLKANIVSSENGLKILEQRLELCYKNNFILKFDQNNDIYIVELLINVE